MRPPMLIGLILALALTAWVALQDDDSAIEPVRREGMRPANASAKPDASAKQDRRARAPAGGASKPAEAQAQMLAQSVAQWQSRQPLAPWPIGTISPWASQQPPPPPPVQVVAAEPPPPMAPPFPHAWVGRFHDDALRAVVASQDRTWVVAVGDVIDGQWRIDQIQERQMSLTYLPLRQRQTVAMKAP